MKLYSYLFLITFILIISTDFTVANEKFVSLSSKSLKKRTTKKISPLFPKSCRCKGVITAYLLINEHGNVIDVTTVKGNPLLQASVNQALRQWLFKPLKVKGDFVKIRSAVKFTFIEDGRVFY